VQVYLRLPTPFTQLLVLQRCLPKWIIIYNKPYHFNLHSSHLCSVLTRNKAPSHLTLHAAKRPVKTAVLIWWCLLSNIIIVAQLEIFRTRKHFPCFFPFCIYVPTYIITNYKWETKLLFTPLLTYVTVNSLLFVNVSIAQSFQR
jgi:glucose-6-phosphate-specific signal transduction histidine kinase